MFCPKCGVDVAEGSNFCAKCGAAIGPQSATAPATGGEKFQRAASSRPADVPEHDVWHGSYSPKAMIGGWIGCGLASVAGMAAGLLVPGAWLLAVIVVAALWLAQTLLLLYRRLSVRYRLTSFRFFHERGLLHRIIDRVEVIDMDDIEVSQGPIERMLGVGTIRITSSDKTDPTLFVPGIDNVRDVAGHIDQLRRAERLRRGLSIESL